MAVYETTYPAPQLIEAVQFLVTDATWPLEIVTLSQEAAVSFGTPYGVQTAQGVTPIFDGDYIQKHTAASPTVWRRSRFEAMGFKRV